MYGTGKNEFNKMFDAKYDDDIHKYLQFLGMNSNREPAKDMINQITQFTKFEYVEKLCRIFVKKPIHL
jgi:hypothetical protein